MRVKSIMAQDAPSMVHISFNMSTVTGQPLACISAVITVSQDDCSASECIYMIAGVTMERCKPVANRVRLDAAYKDKQMLRRSIPLSLFHAHTHTHTYTHTHTISSSPKQHLLTEHICDPLGTCVHVRSLGLHGYIESTAYERGPADGDIRQTLPQPLQSRPACLTGTGRRQSISEDTSAGPPTSPRLCVTPKTPPHHPALQTP